MTNDRHFVLDTNVTVSAVLDELNSVLKREKFNKYLLE
jgi:hypothetical protein